MQPSSSRTTATAIVVALSSLVRAAPSSEPEWTLDLTLTVGGRAGAAAAHGDGGADAVPGGRAAMKAYPSAEEAVPSFLLSRGGGGSPEDLQVRNVVSSDAPCFALYSGGHSAGTREGGGEYLVPESGLVLSTGDPHEFVLGTPEEGGGYYYEEEGDSEETGERMRRRRRRAQDGDESAPLAECFLEFEVKCSSGKSTLADFSYVFGSDLYSEPDLGGGGDSQFGIYINGKNVATVPGDEEDGTVSVGTINASANSSLYVDNTQLAYPDIGAAGLTARIQSSAPLRGKGRWTTVRLALESFGGDVDGGASWAAVRGSPIRCGGEESGAASIVVEDVSPPTASPAPTSVSDKKRKVQFWNPLTGEQQGALPVPAVPKEVAIVVSSLFFLVAMAMVMCAAAKRSQGSRRSRCC